MFGTERKKQMIKNFENVKAQIAELASVINSFKSEAVQLRIIELVLGTPQEAESTEETQTTGLCMAN
jgi:hypothetical protein